MIDIDNWIDRFENSRELLKMQGYGTITSYFDERDITEMLVLLHSMQDLEGKGYQKCLEDVAEIIEIDGYIPTVYSMLCDFINDNRRTENEN